VDDYNKNSALNKNKILLYHLRRNKHVCMYTSTRDIWIIILYKINIVLEANQSKFESNIIYMQTFLT